MGINIEYDRIAFFDNEKDFCVKKDEIKYILCVHYGSSNTSDTNGNIVKDWIVFKMGTMKEIINDLDVFKTSLEGGSFRVNGYKIKDLEQYKTLIKTVLEDAKPFSEFKNYFPCSEHLIEVYHENGQNKHTIEQLRTSLGNKWKEKITKEIFLGDEEILTKFIKPIESMRDIKNYFEEKKYGIKGVDGEYCSSIYLSET